MFTASLPVCKKLYNALSPLKSDYIVHGEFAYYLILLSLLYIATETIILK